jgi:hypothetical protein
MIQELFKLIFKVIKVLYKLLFYDKKSSPVITDTPYDQLKIRVQLDDLTIEDFEVAPIWEFALDEEGEDGQDETTIRPCFSLKVADPADGLFVVKSEFITAHGKKFFGFCTPSFEFKFDEIQPCILTDNGIIPFWSGLLEPTRHLIDELYKQLNENKETLFPIKFKSLVPTKGVKLMGQIDGFMWQPIESETVVNIN